MRNITQIIENGFTTTQVAKITGLTFHTINHWDHNGLVTPSVLEARGRGNTRRYSLDDIIALKIAGMLRQDGTSIPSIDKILKYMLENNLISKPTEDYQWIIIDGEEVFWCGMFELVNFLENRSIAKVLRIFDMNTVFNIIIEGIRNMF